MKCQLGSQIDSNVRPGISAPEVFVVLLIFLIIVALLAPYLQRQRERSRNLVCQNNLRRIGESLLQFAAEDANAHLCSGAADYLRDGCPDRFGWTTDLFRLKGLSGGSYLCPSHSQSGNAALLDLVGIDGKITTVRLPPHLQHRLGGECALFEVDVDGDGLVDQGTVAAGSDAQLALANRLIRSGLKTNYTPSWYLVRTGMKYQPDENKLYRTSRDWDADQIGATLGPLTIDLIERSPVPAQNIPLMAEGAPVRKVPESINLENLPTGTQLVATMLDGPAAWDDESRAIVRLPRGVVTDRLAEGECHVGPFCGDDLPTPTDSGDGGTDGKLWLQDTRHWAPQHPDFSRGTFMLNILMADGSVKQMSDENGDGFLNPGFPIDSTKGPLPAQVELLPFIVFSGEILPRVVPVDVFQAQ